VHRLGAVQHETEQIAIESSLYADLSAFENLRFRAEVYGLDRPKVVAEAAILDFGLSEYARTAAGRLSCWLGTPALTSSGAHSFAEINSSR
jgi:ABC-type Na+ transport system ATPase subunit NatA